MKRIDFDWTIRRAEPADLPLIVDAWLKNYNERIGAFERHCGFWEAQKAIIAKLLERKKTVRVFVACKEETPDRILGYIFGEVEPNGRTVLVHYAYTKARYRRHGVFNALMNRLRGDAHGHADVYFTHEGEPWTKVKRRSRAWSFAPRAIYFRLILELLKTEANAA